MVISRSRRRIATNPRDVVYPLRAKKNFFGRIMRPANRRIDQETRWRKASEIMEKEKSRQEVHSDARALLEERAEINGRNEELVRLIREYIGLMQEAIRENPGKKEVYILEFTDFLMRKENGEITVVHHWE